MPDCCGGIIYRCNALVRIRHQHHRDTQSHLSGDTTLSVQRRVRPGRCSAADEFRGRRAGDLVHATHRTSQLALRAHARHANHAPQARQNWVSCESCCRRPCNAAGRVHRFFAGNRMERLGAQRAGALGRFAAGPGPWRRFVRAMRGAVVRGRRSKAACGKKNGCHDKCAQRQSGGKTRTNR